jgi:lysylphosphatidylglycerol synthetase-like protein (DUF2156 family)
VHAYISQGAWHRVLCRYVFLPLLVRAITYAHVWHATTVTRSKEETNKFRVFEIYKSQEAFDAHNAGEGYGNLMKWAKENDAVVAFSVDKHELLEDVEKGIVV